MVNRYGRSASGRPATALPTSSSEWPSPYAGAVSIQLTPEVTACRIAAIDSASSVVPQPNRQPAPDTAHEPKPTRLMCIPVVPRGRVGREVVTFMSSSLQ
ncbi:hypothetical protein GCM10020256_35570 [Streptomyces thermocoprophilus]